MSDPELTRLMRARIADLAGRRFELHDKVFFSCAELLTIQGIEAQALRARGQHVLADLVSSFKSCEAFAAWKGVGVAEEAERKAREPKPKRGAKPV